MNSTTWMSRYLAGEHEAVWAELRQCPEETPEATAVLTETLVRVRHNVEVLVSRWKARGYVFEEKPWTKPSSKVDSLLVEVERLCGPVPLALRLFWRQVGGVNLIGTHPAWDCTGYADEDSDLPVVYTDPLVLSPLTRDFVESLAEDLEAWREGAAEAPGTAEPFVLPLAPDALHKANVSGGMPYGIRLPAHHWEGRFVGEDPRGVPFIDYLRTCFRWDGLPGLARVEKRLASLSARETAELRPF